MSTSCTCAGEFRTLSPRDGLHQVRNWFVINGRTSRHSVKRKKPLKVTDLNCKLQFQKPTLYEQDEARIVFQVLKTFNGIAMHYRMPLLKSVTEWSMKMNGWDAEDK